MATVLIVDDNEQNLYMLRVLLQTNGYEVLSASQGEEGLSIARSQVPDLVIADILMPVMDGFTFCRQWRADPVLKGKPFLFYTATYTSARDEEFALSLGADRFLLKPQDPDRLLAIVREVLSTAAAMAEMTVPPDRNEAEFLKSYNITLFQKLEKKVADLEAAHQALQRDFALRLELEGQLIQAQKMESLGQIASGIVHDFNNVLTVIGGLASLMTLGTPDRGQLVDWAAKILDAVKMGSGLSRQIMAFARKQELSLTLVDLNKVLTETKSLLRASVPREIELEFSLAPGLPLVRADLTQVQQVFLNLTSNAKDAILPPGRLTIDTALVDLDEEFVRHRGQGEQGQYVRIRFQDNGRGMTPEVLARIFDPFFTTKEPGHGSGLGLSVVYGIVRQHRGFLQVSSVPGRGTCVEVYLPAAL